MRSDLYYKSGYKYQLDKRYFIQTDIFPENDIITDFISLHKNGLMIIERGYAWDGASGIAFDTANTMAASLVHDAGYQLIRDGHLHGSFKGQFDMLLKQVMDEDSQHPELKPGFFKSILITLQELRAEYFFDAVDVFGTDFIEKNKEVICLKAGGQQHGR